MKARWRLGLLLAVCVLVYANSLRNGFTFDDHYYILHNPTVTNGSVRGLFIARNYTQLIRPVTFGTFALGWAAFGPHPFGYHLLSLLLHIAVTLMLYVLFLKLLEFVPQGQTIAFVAALLFAVHPIHTETVASIVGQAELLAMAFLLAAWLLHLRDHPVPAMVCLLLALMAKESAICFLPVVLIGDYVRGKWKPVLRYAGYVGVAVVFLAIFWKLRGNQFGLPVVSFMDNPLANLPAKWRVLNATRIAWKYVGLLFFPATFSCDYSYNAILLYANVLENLPAVIAAVLVLGLWIWSLWKGKLAWFLAGAIYFLGFAFTLNILVPTGTIMGERLAYLPSAGFCLFVALVWVHLEKRLPKAAWALLILIVIALGVRTIVRNRDWYNNYTLFTKDIQAVPRSAKMRVNYGGELGNRGQLEAARDQFQSALRDYPDFAEGLEAYGLVESQLGDNEKARKLLEKAIAMSDKKDADYPYRVVNLAAVLMQLGKNDEALNLLNEQILKAPLYARAWSNRAVILFERGELQSARTDAETALRLDPGNGQAMNVLALIRKAAAAASAP